MAKDVVLEDGLLIFAQRMDKKEPAEDEAPESTSVVWRPGYEWSDQRNMHRTGMSPAMGSDRYGHCAVENRRARIAQERSERGVGYREIASTKPLGRMPRLGVLNPE